MQFMGLSYCKAVKESSIKILNKLKYKDDNGLHVYHYTAMNKSNEQAR